MEILRSVAFSQKTKDGVPKVNYDSTTMNRGKKEVIVVDLFSSAPLLRWHC